MIDNVINNLPQDSEEKKEPAPQREMRETEVKKVRKRVSMKALLPLKKAEFLRGYPLFLWFSRYRSRMR